MKKTTLAFLCIMSMLPVVPLGCERAPTKKTNRLNKCYDTFRAQTYADKQTMVEYDFVDWPRNDPNFVAPINFPQALKSFGVALTNENHLGPDGSRFNWSFKSHTDQVYLAVYSSAKEAQLHLLEKFILISDVLEKGHPWRADGVGDVSFTGKLSGIHFVRKNVWVYCGVRDTSAEATATLNQVCRYIDTVIQTAPPLTEAKAPFKIELNKATVAISEKLVLKVTPEKADVLFSMRCFKLTGPKLEIKGPGSALKSGKSRICTFSSQIPGERLIKLWVCEKSGMVWTFYVRFNVIQ